MREQQIYFESQAPGSDTCGMNALNNLCQRQMFSIEELPDCFKPYEDRGNEPRSCSFMAFSMCFLREMGYETI